MVPNASTAGDTRTVTERRLISSGSSWEERYGYSRAVVTGTHVHVAGTAPIMPGDADPPPGPYDQMRRCLEIAESALLEAGASMADVVRTRVLMTDAGYVPDVMRAHGEAFGAIRPACTGVVVGLLDPRWLVELEIDAVIGQNGAAT
jgi:enamine deaminase RidA (YjgF/YER057c/UK114 family)